MLQKQKKLLPRVICCYFLAVFIPIVNNLGANEPLVRCA